MGKGIVTIVILVAFIATGGVAYHIGDKHGNTKGYAIGYSKGHTDGYSSAPKATVEMAMAQINYEELTGKYNTLVNDYNSLRTAAINYVNTNAYQARAPITCTTHDYSMLHSSTTSCY